MKTFKASTAGLARIKQARKDKGWNVDNPRWLEEASAVLGVNWEAAGYLAEGISEGTWKRFLAGKRPIKADAFKAYSQVLGLNWQEISESVALLQADCDSVQNWGEAPDSGVFYGRTTELATLEQWILKDRCRLVTLLGMGGIGKTALTVKFAESNQEQFQYIIWRSLRYIPPLEDFLGELVQVFSNQPQTVPAGVRAKLSQLIDCLRQYRCLLVLDNFESLLGEGNFQDKIPRNRTGSYLSGYEAYGEFLKRVGESQHQSAVILISREKPSEIAAIESQSLPTRSLQITGLEAIDAREILKAKGLSGEERWETLVNLYQGNPLALNIISTTIQDLFNSNVPEFLNQNTLVITGFTDILEQQFNRLSSLEKQVVYWLAIHCHPVALSQLQTDIGFQVKKSQLIEVLHSLMWRSLIEKVTEPSEVIFTIPPLVMKYVNNKFVEQVCDEIFDENLELLRSHALVNPQKANFKEFQLKPILTAVKEQLTTAFRNDKRLREHLTRILSILEDKPTLEVGYAEENLLKLLAALDSGL
jgi:transcriptional regulator with XRE-family HTH domain